jgi:2-keto-4-pentenoate hydratase/2-oxohepta-3-ene-1,7-dioic acid hydratase in catechol pathway
VTTWVRFTQGTAEYFGTLKGSTIEVYSGDMFHAPVPQGETIELAGVRVVAPVRPGKFIGLWNNFHALAAKLGHAAPTEPLCFLKASNSYLDPEAEFYKPASYDGRIAYEGELGIVIGQRCSAVDEATAETAIFGYTCVNDLTAIDLLNRDPSFVQWTRAKSFDGFGPIGPVIATELDWTQLRIRTLVDGVELQNYPAADMILSPARIVSQLSREMTLMPGDVIACGTSLGVKTIRPGSTAEVVIDGVGTLRNTFAERNPPQG